LTKDDTLASATQQKTLILTQLSERKQDLFKASVAMQASLFQVEQLQAQFHSLIQAQAIQDTFIAQQHDTISAQLASMSQIIRDLMVVRSSMCPHLCSGNGHCLSNDCVCDDSFEGEDCSTPIGAKYVTEALVPKIQATNLDNLFAFDFGRSTHTFIASDEVACGNMSQVTVALWLQPRGGGGATVVSYATSSRDSELLLWLDEDCQTMFMWVNSVSRHDLQGVPVSNFTHAPLCDGRWHHLVISWDGVLGESRTYLDGKFWEMHWSVFYQETIKAGGRIVLGHNQVHLEPRSNAIVPDAFLGVMSDFFFIANATVSDSQARSLFQTSKYLYGNPHVHWSLSNSTAATAIPILEAKITDLGTLNVGATAFGGSWVPAGDRVCSDSSPK